MPKISTIADINTSDSPYILVIAPDRVEFNSNLSKIERQRIFDSFANSDVSFFVRLEQSGADYSEVYAFSGSIPYNYLSLTAIRGPDVSDIVASPLFGQDYMVSENDITADATEAASVYAGMSECNTITYGMVPAYRSLTTLADDLYRSESETAFEIWTDTFESETERLGFAISGDEGDGTVVWLHVSGCKCFEDEDMTDFETPESEA